MLNERSMLLDDLFIDCALVNNILMLELHFAIDINQKHRAECPVESIVLKKYFKTFVRA